MYNSIIQSTGIFPVTLLNINLSPILYQSQEMYMGLHDDLKTMIHL